jgi:hypothetical protein
MKKAPFLDFFVIQEQQQEEITRKKDPSVRPRIFFLNPENEVSQILQ